uniref:Uncharacterized protein n=1 Tax=viral metagenome TaxID=1070528 RepID=A0A6M3LJK2_9ZZZZ
MAVNDSKWLEGQIETIQSSGTTPTIRWHEGKILSVHEYVAAEVEFIPRIIIT